MQKFLYSDPSRPRLFTREFTATNPRCKKVIQIIIFNVSKRSYIEVNEVDSLLQNCNTIFFTKYQHCFGNISINDLIHIAEQLVIVFSYQGKEGIKHFLKYPDPDFQVLPAVIKFIKKWVKLWEKNTVEIVLN